MGISACIPPKAYKIDTASNLLDATLRVELPEQLHHPNLRISKYPFRLASAHRYLYVS